MNNRIKLLVLLITLSMGVSAQKTFQSDVEIIKEHDEFTKTTTTSPSKISSYLDMQENSRFFALMPMIEKGEFITGDFEMLLNIDSIMYVSASYNNKEDSCYIGGANGEFKVIEPMDSIHDKIKQARKDRNNK